MKHKLRWYEITLKNSSICSTGALSIKDVIKTEKEMFGDIDDIKSIKRVK